MTEHVIRFKTIELMTDNGQQDSVSNAIAYDEGSLCVLVGMGDFRARVRVQEFDPDPINVASWK